ncbi:hypothetical protein FE782_19035 [Paenibacillus antri]|uniref:Copper amine oxidase-like N-terminal domain-containing protein n=1 Tax=Paenibacillus antri TaxID=2582848 RepID=A0A5R9G4T7_9BACL|nr:leucine-rich repeat domain-containing protein [Paenibacillus antri]TLS50791.1 hypothetical protein FE782_19035 [Paenibacillus antri]
MTNTIGCSSDLKPIENLAEYSESGITDGEQFYLKAGDDNIWEWIRMRLRRSLWAVAFAITVGNVFPVPCNAAAVQAAVQDEEIEEIHFPDPSLAWLIRQEIGKPAGPILASDVERMETLVIDYDKFEGIREVEGFETIRDLTGIERLTNLHTLELRDGYSVQDVSPIQRLKSLRKLSLWQTTIGDLTPFAELTELRELEIQDMVAMDLEPFRSLTKLESLWLGSNRLKDISALEAMPNLRELTLYAWEERKLNAAPLYGLKNLKLLHIPNAGIENIEFVNAMPELQSLDVRGNPIGDFAPIAGLANLTVLSLAGESVEDLSFVRTLENLKHLEAERTRIRDLTPLAQLVKLETLNLSGNPIDTIAPLASLTNLRTLSLMQTSVRELQSLAGMKQLETLYLYETHIVSLNGIESLPRLQQVNIRRNVVPVDGTPGAEALRDRIEAGGGTFEYDVYPSIPDIVIYLHDERVYAGGKYRDLPAPAYVEASRTMVPLRFITEYLGATVDWNETERMIDVILAGKSVRLTVDSDKADISGKELILDAPPRIVNGTTFVPLRILSEQFGLRVDHYPMLGVVGLVSNP